VALTALQTQGTVTVVAAPRIRTLNNQTAVIKVGLEVPFFNQSSTTVPNGTEQLVTQNTTITTVTVGTIMSITPQISDDGWISMDISPVLTALVANIPSPDQSSTAPELTDKQASTLARVRNGTTVVLGGLIQTEDDQNANKVPVLGDIPVLGQLFTGTYHAKSKNELVIFVTPHIVEPGEPSVKYLDLPKDNKKSDQPF
jgi:MSHA biogenesis protein MshL